MNLEFLAEEIMKQFAETSSVFGKFQQKSGLVCPTGCGKCCMNPEISCAPYELLPLVLHLVRHNRAEEMLLNAQSKTQQSCMFLEVSTDAKSSARCLEYHYRPFICRAFGVSARRGKNENIDFSICSTLKEENREQVAELSSLANLDEIPFIDVWKKQLMAIDPALLEVELPINQSLVLMLEKVLLLENMKKMSVDYNSTECV